MAWVSEDQIEAQPQGKWVSEDDLGDSFVGRMVRPYVRGVKGAASDVNRLLANAAGLAEKGAEFVGDVTGTKPGGAFTTARKWLQEKAEEVAPKPIEGQWVPEAILENITRGVAQLPVYGLAGKVAGPVAGLAGVGALSEADKGPGAAAMSGLQGAATGAAFKATAPLTRSYRAGVLGGGTYAAERMQGKTPEEAATGAATMAAFGAMGPKGQAGGREIVEVIKDVPRRAAELPKVGKAVDVINRAAITDYGKPEEFLDLKRATRARVAQRQSEEFALAKEMAELSPAEQQRAAQVIKGSVTTQPEKYKGAFEAARRFVDLETELRDLKILEGDTFLAKYTRAQRAQMRHALDAKSLLEQAAEAKGAERVEMLRQAKEHASLSSPKYMGMDADSVARNLEQHYHTAGQQYLRRAYELFEKKHKGRLENYPFAWNPEQILEYTNRRQDIPPEIRKELGEIKTAPYLYAKGAMQEVHDVELGKFFRQIAQNPEWSTADPKLAQQKGFVKLDKTLWGDTMDKSIKRKFGDLSEMYVDKYIKSDLQGMVKRTNEFIQAYDKILSAWKAGKVIYNPATWSRNIMSNFILADIVGNTSWSDPRSWPHFASAAKDVLSKSGDYKALVDMGYLGREQVGHEFATFKQAELNKLDPKASPLETLKQIHNTISGGYQGIEQIFKTWVYKNLRARGKSSGEAAKAAEKALFDYSNVPPLVTAAKRFYSPFFTFTYKALPAVATGVIEHPWKAIKYIAIAKAVETYTQNKFGETDEDVAREKAARPEYMRRQTIPLVPEGANIPAWLRIPSKDEHGRTRYWDLSFTLPWGDVAETWGQTDFPARPLMPNHPAFTFISDIMHRRSSFSGHPIWNKLDPASDKAMKFAGHFWRQVMPTWLGIPESWIGTDELQGWNFNKWSTVDNLDRMLRPRDKIAAVLDTILGIKLRAISQPEEMPRRLKELARDKMEVTQEYSWRLEEALRNNQQEKAEKLTRDYTKWAEAFLKRRYELVDPLEEQ